MALRISFKIGGRVQLNNTEVLPVTLAIYNRDGQIEELVSYLTPLPKSLECKFTQWQQYIGLNSERKVVKESQESDAGMVSIRELTNSLKSELNKWLGIEGWIDENGRVDVRVSHTLEHFRQTVIVGDEVQIIVQTEDRQLRGLPWQEWDTLAGYTCRGVEVAISATNFRRLVRRQTPQIKAKVRILVVFGDENLSFSKEREFIDNLKRYGAEPRILNQPTRQDLKKQLEDPQGWHIFFFAGHSESDVDKQFGRIQLNPADGSQGVIEITELRDLLRNVISNKLQLAIFNSCDGLGLANQLTEISLPYCIVMREMVESDVARELLKHFLEAFVNGHSLFTSMNAARQQLQMNFAPGKSWLPVIVANPLAQDLTWNRLFSERRLSWPWEVALGISTLILLISLPVGILSEFHGWDSLILYAQLYPHITIYPSLFLWISLFASYRAHCMIRVKTHSFVICSLITVFITLGALLFELSGDRMMLLELKVDAITTIKTEQLSQMFYTWKTSYSDLANIPLDFFDIRQSFDLNGNLRIKKNELESVIKKINTASQKSKIQGLLRIATSYKAWQHSTEAFSISRGLYFLTFVSIFACGLQILALSTIILLEPDSIFNKNKYLTYLIICELGILLWLPFENYSIEYIKNILFSSEFRGSVVGSNFIIFSIIFILFLLTLKIIDSNATQEYKKTLFSMLLGSLVLTILISVFGVSTIDRLFGLNSTNPLTNWFSGIVFFVPLFFLMVRWIDLHVGDEQI